MSISTPTDLNALVAQARRAVSAAHKDAADLWLLVLQAAPDHPEALFSLGQQKLRGGGDAAGALLVLKRAQLFAPQEPLIPLEIANAFRVLGDVAGEGAAIDQALAADPYCFAALLAKGAFLERAGNKRQAARIYKNALKILPPNASIPPGLVSAVANARAAIAQTMDDYDAFLDARLDAIRKRHSGAKLGRFEECKNIVTGRAKTYVHEPTMLTMPQLAAIQYFDDELFPWLSTLEAAADDITLELKAVLESEARKDMLPYVQYRPGVPVNQWAELNHSPKWTAFYFWENGTRHDAHCALCPRTAEALTRVPLAQSPGFAPTAFFSVLAPGAHIPPHTGSTNVRSIVHLPLIVPGQCSFRVGNETRDWKRGKAWVFDDTIEHEAWNRADKTRVILIFDVWNPLLTAAERELVNALLIAQREFYAGSAV